MNSRKSTVLTNHSALGKYAWGPGGLGKVILVERHNGKTSFSLSYLDMTETEMRNLWEELPLSDCYLN